MKKLSLLFASLLLLAACNQKQGTVEQTAVPLSHIDIESLIDTIDTQMDITALPVSDLRILRNAFAARKGYPFRDAYLRGIFETTTWYDSLMWAFDETSDNFMDIPYDDDLPWRESYYQAIKPEALGYTDEQLAFIDRIKQREQELLKLNFNTGSTEKRVNMDNLVNPAQMTTFPQELYDRLAKNGFAIVPAEHLQLFHVYEQNDYHAFPSFVTTDLYLQLYHLYFDALLREVEQTRYYYLTEQLCRETRSELMLRSDSTSEWLCTFLTVALSLLQDEEPIDNPAARHEFLQAKKAENEISEFLGCTEAPFEYSLFRPRGHYTRNETLQRYFRAMMWLQTVPFRTDNEQQMRRALRMAQTIGESNRLTAIYKTLTEPLTFLMGEPDDVSILQVWDIAKAEPDFTAFCRKVDQLAEQQTHIRPRFQRSGRNKVRLMPQRYQPDAEVLQEMVDYDSEVTKRSTPRGLDVFAALGNSLAEKILTDEFNEAKRWEQYKPNLERMKLRMDSVNWQQNVAVKWIEALKTVTETTDGAPYFMLTPEWGRKDLNAALASWAELKHDAILYAKQPMGAECGAGGPPEPVVKGYVEPNVKFWRKAIDLLKQTNDVFETYGMHTERTRSITEQMSERLAFLLKASEKELEGQALTDEECDQIEHIGAAFENLSLEMLREPEQNLWEWEAIQGPERSVALVADVYTANADNNPQQSILYEGVGPADELYVVVEIDGYLYLMRGAVFSYREFTRPYNEQRMNDEEWQERLKKDPRQGVPSWMEPITVPLKEAPVDNEEVFYSSGC